MLLHSQIHGIKAKRFVLLLLFSHFTRICKLNFPFIIFQFHLLQFWFFVCFFLQILHLILCTQCHQRKKENLVQITIHLASKHLQISLLKSLALTRKPTSKPFTLRKHKHKLTLFYALWSVKARPWLFFLF